jgi:sialidase-1
VNVPYNSAYSSLCILPDGTIGMYVEEDPNGGDHYEMVFYNFTLEWLEGNHE